MKYRRFGRTELAMPVFSCGGMRYQFKWQDVNPHEIPPDNQRNLEATIHRAMQLGINHIETARGYGSSEMQLGEVLPRLPRSQIIVRTKVAPFGTAEEFLRTFDRSLKYLKLDHVDLLALHGINHREHLSWALRKGAAWTRRASCNAKDSRASWVSRPTPPPTSFSRQSRAPSSIT